MITTEELYRALLIWCRDEWKWGLDDLESIEEEGPIESAELSSEDSAGWGSVAYALHDNGATLLSNGCTVEVADLRSGGDEQGTVMWLVLKVTDADGNVGFFRKDGWYASFDGGYWEGEFYQVQPRDRVVTFYEKG